MAIVGKFRTGRIPFAPFMNPFLLRPLAAVAALAFATGCQRHDDHGHPYDAKGGHEHEHEEKTAQVTVWTDRHEVFAEHKAPVVSQPTTFITHITDLRTLAPRREGPVKFVLRQGETMFEHPQAKPARAGIYLPGIVFPKPGIWEMMLLIPDGGSNATVELGKIEVYADAHAAQHADISDGPEGVSFLKEQQWKILSKAELVAKRRLVERARVPAVVAARPGALAQVAAPQAGRLLAAPGRTLPVIGDTVTAGQTVVVLQPAFAPATALEYSARQAETAARVAEFTTRAVEAGAELARAKLAIEQAEVTVKRLQTLVAAKARPERELQEAEFAVKDAKAKHAAALVLEAAFRDAATAMRVTQQPVGPAAPPVIEIKSPIAGTVVFVSVGALGEQLAADRVVFTVLDVSRVFLEAKVPESGIRRLPEAKAATLELPGERGAFLPVTGAGGGRLVFTGLQVDPATRTVPIVYEFPNPAGRLRLGEFVTLQLETGRAEDAVAVPESALVEEGEQLVAFVQISGETFQKRDIKPGLRDSGWVQVLHGLKEGERVVTQGAYTLRLSSISGVIPAHGHAH